jgi:uncharacterized protein (TIGR02118 family)
MAARTETDPAEQTRALSPLALMHLSTAFWGFKTLAAAQELDLFTRLAGTPGATAQELAEALSIDPRPAEMLLTGCAALGLLQGRHQMLKVIVLLRRREGLSREEFERYWRERHLPLVARIPGLRRLVLNRVLPDPGGSPPSFDAVVEDWFDDAPGAERGLGVTRVGGRGRRRPELTGHGPVPAPSR